MLDVMQEINIHDRCHAVVGLRVWRDLALFGRSVDEKKQFNHRKLVLEEKGFVSDEDNDDTPFAQRLVSFSTVDGFYFG